MKENSDLAILIAKTIGFSVKSKSETLINLILDDLVKEIIPILNKREASKMFLEQQEKKKILLLCLKTKLADFYKEKIEFERSKNEIIDLQELKNSSANFKKASLFQNEKNAKIKLSFSEERIENICEEVQKRKLFLSCSDNKGAENVSLKNLAIEKIIEDIFYDVLENNFEIKEELLKNFAKIVQRN